MKKRDEEKFDMMLHKVIEDMLKEQINELPSPEELKEKNRLSGEHEKKMDELIKKAERSRKKSKTDGWIMICRNVAAAFGLFFIVGFLVAFTVPRVRVALKEYLLTTHDEYSDIDVHSEDESIDEPYNYPVYVPEGFGIVDVNETSGMLMVFYVDENEDFIRVERFEGEVSVMIDAQGALIEEVDILEGKGQLKTKDRISTLVFNTSNYVYKITTDTDSNEIIKMANSIIVK